MARQQMGPRGPEGLEERRYQAGGPRYGIGFGRLGPLAGWYEEFGYGAPLGSTFDERWRSGWEMGPPEHRWRGGVLGWIGSGIRAMAGWLGDRMAGTGAQIGRRLRGSSVELGSALRGRGEQVGAALERRAERGTRWPRSYQRPDERILDDVYQRIVLSGAEVEEVEIEVSDGIVTLSGTVPSRFIKRLVEDLAEEVFGVREVHNHLQLARPAVGEAQREAPLPEGERLEKERMEGGGARPDGGAQPEA